MSQVRVTGRPIVKLDSNQLTTVLKPLLAPILNQIAVLTEAVTSLVNAFSSERKNTCEFACASLMGKETQRHSKNFESLKQLLSINEQSIAAVSEKLANMERLLSTLMKNQARKRQDAQEFYPPRLKPSTKSSSGTYVGLEASSMSVITLNSEKDYPGGSWLGDPLQPNARVRCHIPEEDLIFLSTKCATPTKMALTLLDHLFSKETLATSNLSGRSKLGKKQLDPLLVYGIKCHLAYHFNTSDKQWERIKHNIDSKCRTAWKKRRLAPSGYCLTYGTDEDSADFAGQGHVQDETDNRRVIQLLQATGDHVLRVHDLQNVHVLDGDHILPMMSSDGEDVETVSQDSNQGPVIADSVNFAMEPILPLIQHSAR